MLFLIVYYHPKSFKTFDFLLYKAYIIFILKCLLCKYNFPIYVKVFAVHIYQELLHERHH